VKTLSVLFTFVLLIAVDQLAAHLKRANALPADTAHPANNITATGLVARFPIPQHTNNETSEEF
jgi:hypothetical protein